MFRFFSIIPKSLCDSVFGTPPDFCFCQGIGVRGRSSLDPMSVGFKNIVVLEAFNRDALLCSAATETIPHWEGIGTFFVVVEINDTCSKYNSNASPRISTIYRLQQYCSRYSTAVLSYAAALLVFRGFCRGRTVQAAAEACVAHTAAVPCVMFCASWWHQTSHTQKVQPEGVDGASLDK